MVLSGHGGYYFFSFLSTVPAAKLSVAPQAKEAFAMTKLHKDVAVRLIQCTDDEEFTDQATIKVPIPLKHSLSDVFISLSPSLSFPSFLPLSFTGLICEDTGVDQ